ncbi:hypothetical protein AB9P05_10885 [Roseivirga sp. BDSF3-8]|uniref:hypothetical protein n=1 Tax=Roseivirga sp. BDSF3-8 TaxID=3241598 RepID=UPI0035318666
MKNNRIISSAYLYTLLFILPGFIACGQEEKQVIPIDLDGKYGVVYVNSYFTTKSDQAIRLVDEQELGRNLEKPAKSEWQPTPRNNWMGKGTPREVKPWITIDFPGYYRIHEIAFFDGPGEGRFTIYSGDVPDWVRQDSRQAHQIVDTTLQRYMKWTTVTPASHQPTRRVLIQVDAADSTNSSPRAPMEIVFYGEKVKDLEEIPEYNTPTQHALIKDFWGVNTFNDDPQGPKMAFSRLRNYHNWEWVEYKEDTLLFEGNSRNGFNFNRYYNNMARLGLENWPVLKATPTWLRNNTGSNNWAPAPPASYDTMMLGGMFGQYAQYHRIWADKYGQPRKNDEGAPGQIRYLQIGNEWDKNWDDRQSLMLAWEYAPMVSQVYDSLRTAERYVGLLDAPDARPDIHRKKAVAMWFEAFGKPYPFAALADHHYSNTAGGQGYSKAGISPEADSLLLYTHTEEIGHWIDRWLPDSVAYWRTEYGWDTHPQSGQRAPAIGNKNEEQVQAEWIIRGALYHAALPIDELYMYMLRDVDVLTGKYAKGKYRTSGFLKSRDADYAKKPAWYYANTLLHRLGDYRFHSWLPSGDKNIRVQKWLHEDGQTPAYVLWRGTSDGSTTKDFRLPLPQNVTISQAIGFADKQPTGTELQARTESGEVIIQEVSESPVMLFASQNNDQTSAGASARLVATPSKKKNLPRLYRLTPPMVSHNKPNAGTELVDNQTGAGDPLAGQGNVLDDEPNFSKGFDLPLTTTITLPQEEEVAWLYFFDTNGDGRMSIEVEDARGNRTPIGEEYFQVYMKWADWAVNQKVKKIHLTFHEPGANLKEVLVYTR